MGLLRAGAVYSKHFTHGAVRHMHVSQALISGSPARARLSSNAVVVSKTFTSSYSLCFLVETGPLTMFQTTRCQTPRREQYSSSNTSTSRHARFRTGSRRGRDHSADHTDKQQLERGCGAVCCVTTIDAGECRRFAAGVAGCFHLAVGSLYTCASTAGRARGQRSSQGSRGGRGTVVVAFVALGLVDWVGFWRCDTDICARVGGERRGRVRRVYQSGESQVYNSHRSLMRLIFWRGLSSTVNSSSSFNTLSHHFSSAHSMKNNRPFNSRSVPFGLRFFLHGITLIRYQERAKRRLCWRF